jgi:hypothetical protein
MPKSTGSLHTKIVRTKTENNEQKQDKSTKSNKEFQSSADTADEQFKFDCQKQLEDEFSFVDNQNKEKINKEKQKKTGENNQRKKELKENKGKEKKSHENESETNELVRETIKQAERVKTSQKEVTRAYGKPKSKEINESDCSKLFDELSGAASLHLLMAPEQSQTNRDLLEFSSTKAEKKIKNKQKNEENKEQKKRKANKQKEEEKMENQTEIRRKSEKESGGKKKRKINDQEEIGQFESEVQTIKESQEESELEEVKEQSWEFIKEQTNQVKEKEEQSGYEEEKVELASIELPTLESDAETDNDELSNKTDDKNLLQADSSWKSKKSRVESEENDENHSKNSKEQKIQSQPAEERKASQSFDFEDETEERNEQMEETKSEQNESQDEETVEENVNEDSELTGLTTVTRLTSFTGSTQNKQFPFPDVLFDRMEFLITGVETSEAGKLQRKLKKLGGTVYNTPNEAVKALELIVLCDQPKPTGKYLMSLAIGRAPVHIHWVEECIKQKKIIPIKDYLVDPSAILTGESEKLAVRGANKALSSKIIANHHQSSHEWSLGEIMNMNERIFYQLIVILIDEQPAVRAEEKKNSFESDWSAIFSASGTRRLGQKTMLKGIQKLSQEEIQRTFIVASSPEAGNHLDEELVQLIRLNEIPIFSTSALKTALVCQDFTLLHNRRKTI